MGQKRRRIALSCVDCRKRKVKCDRTYPSCIRCQKAGCGDSCLYVTHTGPEVESGDGLPTSSVDDGRQQASQRASIVSWGDEAAQYVDTAHANQTNAPQTEYQIAKAGATTGGLPPASSHPGLQRTDQKLHQLQGRLTDLETMVYSAGGKPISHEIHVGMLNPMGPGAGRDRNYYADKYTLADHEKVLLRGKSFKTQYFGPSHCLAILLQFEDLSKFVREIFLTLPSLQHAKHSIAKIREKEKQAASQHYDLSIDSLVNMVPERALTDRLVYHYLDTIETTYRIVHVPTFLKDYKAFWVSPKDSKPESVVQLLVAMSCVYCIVAGGEEGFVGRSSAKRETASYWINVCSFWLESQSQKHVSLVNYQLHIQLWLSKLLNVIKVKRYWTDSGMLVRRFMAAGLHREPTLLCGKINTFDCEMRRRLWYTVLELDLQTTLDRGMTPTIGAMDWDTQPPLNIDDESFDVDTEVLPSTKPKSDFTRTSFLAWAAESLPLRIELLYKINSIRNTLEQTTINEYDHKLRVLLDDIPLNGWIEYTLNAPVSSVASVCASTATANSPVASTSLLAPSSRPSSLVPVTLSQAMLSEYITILHQAFPTDTAFKSQRFYSRAARRYSCNKTILLYNPQLSVPDVNTIHRVSTIPERLCLSGTQRRFFANLREDYARAALSLAHDFAVSTSSSMHPFPLHLADNNQSVGMAEAVVTMLGDRVEKLGQGFHGYWIVSSALSYVHSKQSPDVPRQTFVNAAADRVIQLHDTVMNGQLPRARRMMLPTQGNVPTRSVSPVSDTGDERGQADRTAEQIGSSERSVRLQASRSGGHQALGKSYADNSGFSGIERTSDMQATNGLDIGGGASLEFDQSEPFQDITFGFEDMDWGMLMNADPMDFMGGLGSGSGSWDFPS